jgi:hypothetical protein
MANKETLQEFIKNWHKFDDKVVRSAIAGWNSNTLLAMVKAQFYSPVDKGNLQGSARRVKAKITPTGIKSSYIFAEPYAYKLEKGVRDDGVTPLNIKTTINPNARSGYASKGADDQEPEFMRDLYRAISKAWREI